MTISRQPMPATAAVRVRPDTRCAIFSFSLPPLSPLRQPLPDTPMPIAFHIAGYQEPLADYADTIRRWLIATPPMIDDIGLT
jgi:hypothetical protein